MVPSTEEMVILSTDSSLWYDPVEPSAHPSIVLDGLGSTLLAFPSKRKPDEQDDPTVLQNGALYAASKSAIKFKLGVELQ